MIFFRLAIGASLAIFLACSSGTTPLSSPPVTTGMLKPDVLYLNLLNRTTMAGSADSTGYADDDVYLIVTGRPGDKLPIQHLNWVTGKFEPMDHVKDNSVSLDYVPFDRNLKYAPYWTTLSALKTSSLYDADKGLLIPTPVYSGRMHISFGRPVYLQVAVDNQTAAEPSEADPLDPSYNTIWDKFEFTANTDHVLYSNTTCVDFVGIPLAYKVYRVQKDGTTAPAGGPAGFDLSSAEAAADPMAYLTKPFLADTQLKVLLQGARLLAPKVETDLIAPFGKGTYMDSYIHYCWGQYHTKQTEIPLFGYVDIPKAENGSVTTNDEGKGVRWEATGKMMDGNTAGTQGSLTFKVTKLTKGTKSFTPPTESFTIGLPSSWDTLRQGGAFQISTTLHTKTYTQAIDGDIKNQVSTALNRCVMHGDYQDWFDPKDTSKGKAWWANTSMFFQQNNVPDASFRTNHYARLLHNVSLDKKCYALA
ncbi:MAG: beta-1,3-glucanase family protein, partial [Holophaga sp.]|nr:beta-1,3-glucanase family protein [Holophaga sp.]